MSKKYYSKKLIQTNLSFNKTSSLSHDDNGKIDYKKYKKNKDSWQFFINLKNIQNLKRRNNFRTINGFLNPNYKNNPNFVPISNKYSIIKLNKSPSLNENFKEINTIIKRNKAKKLKDFNNIFNTILINKSRSFRNQLYITCGEMNSNSKLNITSNRDRKLRKEYAFRNNRFTLINDNNSFSNDNIFFNNEAGLNTNSIHNESNLICENIMNKSKSLPKLNFIKKEFNNYSLFNKY